MNDETVKTPELLWNPGSEEDNSRVTESIAELIRTKEKKQLVSILRKWPLTDLVELFRSLPLKRARKLFKWMPQKTAARILAELTPDFRTALMADVSIARVSSLLDSLDPEDIIEILDDFPEGIIAQMVPHLKARKDVEINFSYPKETAGSIMSSQYIAVPKDYTIERTIREVRTKATGIEKLYAVFIVDEERRPIGFLKLRDLLVNDREAIVAAVMRQDLITVTPEIDQEIAAHLAERYELSVVPVINDAGQLIGRITADRFQQVFQEEADEDMKLMSGVAVDSRSDESILRIVRGRLPWLVTGLVGASLAAAVVGTFKAELEQAAILASFIPIVMAMAGNAGIQASTVSVQGLTAGSLQIGDLGWRVGKECVGGLLNGAAVALMLALLVLGAAQIVDVNAAAQLALAAGISLVAVTIIAATIGAMIPLLLDYFKIDPALATGVFITTSNDILGVLVFFLLVTNIYFN